MWLSIIIPGIRVHALLKIADGCNPVGAAYRSLHFMEQSKAVLAD